MILKYFTNIFLKTISIKWGLPSATTTIQNLSAFLFLFFQNNLNTLKKSNDSYLLVKKKIESFFVSTALTNLKFLKNIN